MSDTATSRAWTIAQLAKRADTAADTVRYYLKRGLLESRHRNAAGYRFFDERDLSRLLFIRSAKRLGFTLKEIGELLSIRDEPDTACERVCDRAKAKVEAIDRKIEELGAIRQELASLINSCSSGGPADDCRVIRRLTEQDTSTRSKQNQNGAARAASHS